MPDFELSGPDGAKFQVTAPDENSALSAFQQFSGGVSRETAPAAPISANDVVRATATGVPIAGGVLNKLNAATNAALAPALEPLMEKSADSINDAPGATALERFVNRYKKSLAIQDAQDAKFAKEHPIVDMVAKVAGGVGATIPLVMAAPAMMGASGTLPQMVTRGAASGAGISAADAAVRGEDVVTGAGVGGALGAGAPLVARGVGAIARAVRPAPAVAPMRTAPVGGVEVPLTQSQVTGDAAQSAEEQILARGGRGERAQGVAQDFEGLQNERLGAATDEIAAGLDPAGVSARTAPQAAGERVIDELAQADATRIATDNARRARVAASGEELRAGVGVKTDPVTGAAVPVAESPFVAAETVGAGVAARRDAHVARTRGLYDEVRDAPGVFDPAVPKGLAEDIRGRLDTGPDPIWIDPDSTSKANEALKLIDQTVGEGMFKNAAARRAGPVGPVAEAAAGGAPKAPATEAEAALAELVAKGINPAKARAAVAELPGGRDLPVGPLDAHDVALPNGQSVKVAPKVVEASSIKTSADAGYDAALQPRDRSRAASSAQVNDMARNLNPNRLGVSSEADRGAPIVGADGMVESGNGRVLAVRQAYAEGGESAAKYRAWLESQGVDVSKFREPVLVRERVTPMTPAERKAFTVSANQSSTLSLSAPERALADSRALTPESLTLIRNPADLGAVENREFVRAFMNGVPQAERGALMTASGDLSSEGLSRVRNAVLAKAYGDTPILSRIAESTSDDIKSISNALVSSAPEWASLKGAIAAGHVPAEMDVTKDLLDAVNRTARIRGKGVSLESSQAQADAFSAQSEESKLFQRMFYDADGAKAAPAAQVSSALRNYAQEAAKVDAAPGLGLGLPPVTARDILEVTAKKMGAPAELAKEVVERAAAIATPAAAGEPITEVGLREMDAARKRLVVMYGDAKRAAMGPGGSGSDMRAMGRILHEFDNSIIDAFDAGRFSGDGEAAKALLRDARASHALYRETFTNRGGTDPVGRSIEKILGRYADTAATPDEIARLSYGSRSEPGGGDAMKVAQRLKQILGPTSPEWGAYKQGLVSHVMDDVPGAKPMSPAEKADRIEKFLTGTKGRGLAQIALSAEERAGLKSYADNLRMTEPVAATTPIDKTIARIAGRDGGVPMSGDEVVDLLVSKNVSGNKGFAAALADRLKRDLSPEGWTSVRQGMWSKVTEPLAGKPELQAQALYSRITGFLDSDLAKSAYSAAERAKMESLAKVYKQIIPVKGTTNPSGTAPMLAKVARGMSNNLLTMLGAVHSGFIGAGVGYGLQKGLAGVAERRGAKSAVDAFYGSQPRAPIKSSRVPIVLSQGATPAQQQ